MYWSSVTKPADRLRLHRVVSFTAGHDGDADILTHTLHMIKHKHSTLDVHDTWCQISRSSTHTASHTLLTLIVKRGQAMWEEKKKEAGCFPSVSVTDNLRQKRSVSVASLQEELRVFTFSGKKQAAHGCIITLNTLSIQRLIQEWDERLFTRL